MKVCILGNSHVGPLARAFHTLPDASELDWSFFAVPNGFAGRTGLRALSVDAAARQVIGFPTNKLGKSGRLNVDSFDVFFIVGGLPAPSALARILAPRFSSTFGPAAIDDICRHSQTAHVFDLIASLREAHIHVTSFYAKPQAQKTPHAKITEATELLNAFWRAKGATYLPQPPELIVEGGFTPPEFFVGANDSHLKTEPALYVVKQFRQVLGV